MIQIRSMIKTRSYDNIAKYLSTNCSKKYGQETTRMYLDVSSEVIGKKFKLKMTNNNALDCKAKTIKHFNRRFLKNYKSGDVLKMQMTYGIDHCFLVPTI